MACVRGTVLVAAAALALGCGGSDRPTAARSWAGGAVKMGVVSGFVVDDETGAAIANAQVSIGGQAVRARADGSFDATVPAGRTRVEVKKDGFVQTLREIAVGNVALNLPFKLARKEAPQMVGSGGGTLRFREAQVLVPAGAFGADTALSLTYLERVRVAVTSSSPQFLDADKVPRRAVATVVLDSGQPPAVAVRVRVPVPPDAAMDSVKAFAVDASGQWAAGFMPLSVSAGVAEFELTGNSHFGVTIDVRKADGRRIGYLVTEAGSAAMRAGDILPDGNQIDTASRAVSLVDPQGSRVELGPATRARVQVAGETPPATGTRRLASFAGEAVLSQGRARVVVPPALGGTATLIKLSIKTPAAVLDVRGTAFTVTSCASGSGFVDVLEVVEGTVDAQFNGKPSAVRSGESATFCTNCAEGAAPQCGPADDGGVQPPPDVLPSTPDTASVRDTAVAIDTAPDVTIGGDLALPLDGGTLPPPDGPTLPPDAGVAIPDTAVPPPTDTALPVPDAAAPDLAPPPPDVALAVDTAVAITEDAAPPAPDAAPAFLSISPASEDWGNVEVTRQSAVTVFTITNTGDSATGQPLVQVSPSAYVIDSNTCLAPLPAKGSCTVGVKFASATVGQVHGALTVSATPGDIATADLLASAVASPQLEMTPLAQYFGTIAPNLDAQIYSFTVKNIGGVPTGIPMAFVEGRDKDAFAIESDGCTAALGSGEQCGLSIKFQSQVLGLKMGILRVTATRGGTVSSALTGNVSWIEVTPPSYDYGAQMIGSATAAFSFTVKHLGTANDPAIHAMPSLTGADYVQFNIVGQPCLGSLAGGQSCVVPVNFAPRDVGARTAALTVNGVNAATGAILGSDKAALTGSAF